MSYVSPCIALYSFFVVSLYFSLWSACIFAGRLEVTVFHSRVMYGFFLAFLWIWPDVADFDRYLGGLFFRMTSDRFILCLVPGLSFAGLTCESCRSDFVAKAASVSFEYKFDSAISWSSFAISSAVADLENYFICGYFVLCCLR